MSEHNPYRPDLSMPTGLTQNSITTWDLEETTEHVLRFLHTALQQIHGKLEDIESKLDNINHPIHTYEPPPCPPPASPESAEPAGHNFWSGGLASTALRAPQQCPTCGRRTLDPVLEKLHEFNPPFEFHAPEGFCDFCLAKLDEEPEEDQVPDPPDRRSSQLPPPPACPDYLVGLGSGFSEDSKGEDRESVDPKPDFNSLITIWKNAQLLWALAHPNERDVAKSALDTILAEVRAILKRGDTE